ncbi:TetR family transcriptional regulator [Pseudodesulfovibrio cashew]|uniref:TetR family transcriptional regulator n=1 Tax=Pseudodesulfovibrio cashew TaxID=2678688 RepID=A0A6I6JMY2_9BACT|nr:TetR/AcrR family transcriptional regulator [Pseudodesulfovibrio cashew]QGY41453.1 TetR family transcriptional regulator [Pseudodesulfovibrio cashew]
MSRHQEFDSKEALHQAMKLFWHKGYEATSIMDLLKTTGLSKSSLYATFGGKRDLFLAAFDSYRDTRREEASRVLSHSPARDGIEQFYRIILEGAKADEFTNGCMSINQAVEMAPHDEDVRVRVKQDFQCMERMLTQTIERGRIDGSIKGRKTPRELARILVVAFPGLQVMVRAKCDHERLDEAFNLVLSLLDEE